MAEASLASLAPFAAVNLTAAMTGGVFRPGAWYEALRKPSFTPPNFVFPIAWSILYAMITAAGWFVWRAGGAEAWPALLAYAIHMPFNAAWSWLFFGLRRMDLALVNLCVAWVTLVVVMAMFAPISLTAALLLVPYLAWVTFAAVLNYGLVRLNAPATTGG